MGYHAFADGTPAAALAAAKLAVKTRIAGERDDAEPPSPSGDDAPAAAPAEGATGGPCPWKPGPGGYELPGMTDLFL